MDEEKLEQAVSENETQESAAEEQETELFEAEAEESEAEELEAEAEEPAAEEPEATGAGKAAAAAVTAGTFSQTHPVLKEVIDWVGVLAAAIILTFIIRTFIFTMVVVEGPSMEQTLYTGDRLAVVRIGYHPAQGDIIVFYPNGNKERPYIKRVIALAGQTVDIRNAEVFVDGEAISEPYLGSPTTEAGNQQYPLTVPEGCLFAMGDNRQHSLDCRSTTVGLVKLEDIVGKAWARLYPFGSRFGGLY